MKRLGWGDWKDGEILAQHSGITVVGKVWMEGQVWGVDSHGSHPSWYGRCSCAKDWETLYGACPVAFAIRSAVRHAVVVAYEAEHGFDRVDPPVRPRGGGDL